MRILNILLVTMLCTGCSLRAHDIKIAPPEKNQAVVFDIDGTLTPKVSAVFKARDDAAKAATLFADKGYFIIYLTARNRFFQSGIPRWLKRNGFPQGNIQVTKTAADRANHAAYKKRVLKEFQNNGWTFFAAYGDKSTDFKAYSEVGIDKSQVFALLGAGEEACDPGNWAECLNSWSDHLDHITQMIQP